MAACTLGVRFVDGQTHLKLTMSKSSLKLTKYMSEIKHDLLNNILCLQIFYMNKNSVLPVNKKFNSKV